MGSHSTAALSGPYIWPLHNRFFEVSSSSHLLTTLAKAEPVRTFSGMTTKGHAAARNPPRLSAQDPSFATVLVGPEKKRFVVHQDLLVYHSDFFKAAFNGNFKEAADKSMTLSEDSPQVFEFFVHWMYNKAMPSRKNAHAELLEMWAKRNDKGSRETGSLIRLHVFADKYNITDLKHDTLSRLFEHFQSFDTCLPKDSQITFAYDNLPAGSSFLKYLVRSYCDMAKSQTWKEHAAIGNSLPPAFLTEVLSLYADHVWDTVCYLPD